MRQELYMCDRCKAQVTGTCRPDGWAIVNIKTRAGQSPGADHDLCPKCSHAHEHFVLGTVCKDETGARAPLEPVTNEQENLRPATESADTST
jgi:hypothetical protein